MLLEVVRGAKTDDDVLATVMALAKMIKNVAVVTAVTFGFIGNRMLRQRQTKPPNCCSQAQAPSRSTRSTPIFGMPMACSR
jgi:3-hydroxyacyl-CoA dehydrogenase